MPVSRVVTALHLGLGEFSRAWVEDTYRGEREREGERDRWSAKRTSVGGRETARRGEIRGRQRGKGTDGTHNQPNEQSLCVISDACAPRRPNLQSSSYTSSSDRISTRFFHQLFHSIPRTVDAEALVSLLLPFLLFFSRFSFSRAFVNTRESRNLCIFLFIIAGIREERGREGKDFVFFCF